jgi:hypothetical protein
MIEFSIPDHRRENEHTISAYPFRRKTTSENLVVIPVGIHVFHRRCQFPYQLEQKNQSTNQVNRPISIEQ